MAASLGLTASLGIAQALACTPGDQACPVLLTMKAGASVIEATGTVSRERPIFYFKFVAEAGQTVMVHTTGGGLKTGPGIPIAGPSGAQDALDEDTPYTAPASGPYVIELHANTMSDGPFGPFRLRLRIK
ncbi:MAG: hypothetical protein JO273_20140 [Methylobacteriaceae bacterium]|nr:hypothetical protein [Methylobacteriaceae bacterium]